MPTPILTTINLVTKFEVSSYTHSKDMMGFQNLRSDQRILTKANITGGGFFMGGYNVM